MINLPKHVAIIMDGNRRWAKTKNRPIFKGHKFGVKSLKSILLSAVKLRIEILTLFAFSFENLGRDKKEVDALFEIFSILLDKKIDFLTKNNIQLKIFGDISVLKESTILSIKKAEKITSRNTGLKLNVGINYGGRQDILQAVKNIVSDFNSNNDLSIDKFITEEKFREKLFLGNFDDIDLLIRTGGEQRISNFLLWHLAYTEFYFTDTFWPSFKEIDFIKAVDSFGKRERRFGKK
ncbi:MAG: polyprenyl diphosphate synthase [Psittacicella sp.]